MKSVLLIILFGFLIAGCEPELTEEKSECVGPDCVDEEDNIETGPYCGNGICDGNEDCSVCPTDCGSCQPECGDGVCQEDCSTCPTDCGECSVCGDGTCDSNEDCNNCATECAPCEPVCGDGKCATSEDCRDCEEDCLSPGEVCCSRRAYFGDCCFHGDCDANELCIDHSCVMQPFCGDKICDKYEDCEECPVDCGTCPPVCDDGVCEGDENCENCPEDCLEDNQVCCHTMAYFGECCDNADCDPGYMCLKHRCSRLESCTDTDGGININVKGGTYGYTANVTFNNTDYCVNSGWLMEYYCDHTTPMWDEIDCTLGSLLRCADGACE